MRRTSPEEEVLVSKASQLAVRKRKIACAFSSYFLKRRKERQEVLQKERQQQHKSREAHWIGTGTPRLKNKAEQTVEQSDKSENSF